MRNKTAFIFVLLANMILLAHAVIPHHHHNQDSLSVLVECNQHQEHNHNENTLICNDEHDGRATTACSLSKTLLIPNNQIRDGEKSVDMETSDILFIALFISNLSSQDIHVNELYQFSETLSIATRFLISSQGLRAPPVC